MPRLFAGHSIFLEKNIFLLEVTVMTSPYASRLFGPLMILAVTLPLAGIAAPAQTHPPAKTINPEADKYIQCVTRVATAPDQALDMATAWRAGGGGVSAQHCIALALVQLEKYDEAARRLEDVAQDLQSGQGTFGLTGDSNAVLLPQVYGQAGNAWLMAGNYSRAYAVLSTALANVVRGTALEADLLVDRARAQAGLLQYAKALPDLDKAQKISPERADILIYRAASLRILKRFDEAATDLAAALKLDPDNPSALVERGNLRLENGDRQAARADWQRVVVKYPETPEADAANKNLAANPASVATPPALSHSFPVENNDLSRH
jgi:tetratricopeptide (TPR) repeat protein